jgi:hypothetical protein
MVLVMPCSRVAGQESPFSLYVANLPIGVAGVPTFFPRDAVQVSHSHTLHGSYLHNHLSVWGYERLGHACLPHCPLQALEYAPLTAQVAKRGRQVGCLPLPLCSGSPSSQGRTTAPWGS